MSLLTFRTLLGTIPYAAPVAFAGLGEGIGQLSGLINVGLEGMMLTGAYFALVGTTHFSGPYAVEAGFGCGIAAAVLLSIISAIFTVWLDADQVVVGTAVNLFALGLTTSLYRNSYGQSGSLISLPSLVRWGGFDALVLAFFVMLPGAWFVINRTEWGLAVRAAGDHPPACESAGFSVRRMRTGAAVVGGVFAGIGGAYLVLGTTATFSENMTAGRGFLAIALVTFGRWKPSWIALAALFLGVLDAMQYQLQATGVQVSAYLLQALPYLGALVVLSAAGTGNSAPRSLAIPLKHSE